jgi:hypothetical protein
MYIMVEQFIVETKPGSKKDRRQHWDHHKSVSEIMYHHLVELHFLIHCSKLFYILQALGFIICTMIQYTTAIQFATS